MTLRLVLSTPFPVVMKVTIMVMMMVVFVVVVCRRRCCCCRCGGHMVI